MSTLQSGLVSKLELSATKFHLLDPPEIDLAWVVREEETSNVWELSDTPAGPIHYPSSTLETNLVPQQTFPVFI